MELDGRVAVVTGGTRGLGLTIAREFLREGASVVCAARTGGEFKTLLDDHPGHVRYQRADVTDPDSVEALMTSAVDAFGALDVVVANAGVNRDGRAERLAVPDWRVMIDTNLTGVFLCTRAAVPHLRERGGAIVNLSSIMASRPTVGAAGYSASKAAVEAFTRVTAIELGRYSIRVNALAPGFLDEGMGRAVSRNDKVWEAYRRRFALGRVGEAREAARAAVFLASDEASYVNGSVLEVSGGLLWS
ncbi:SDR family NAD(P)-dependent oxidoreductase [Actinomadura oligospora]|uniref:SDR family NAD(P)-dependent oxidoreductase n=1 Tax=Actinomadura oligospora TaxID=111804 RepID=UPI00047A40E1|nr:SDR family NAD(P)-dependent oxidoreductase [Actinomadura oligospora]